MYHDQNSQSSSSDEETIIEENNIHANGASHPIIAHEKSVQQQPLRPLPPQRQPQQHNGTNGRQLYRNVDGLQKNQATNFAQWLTDIDSRLHICLGSIKRFP